MRDIRIAAAQFENRNGDKAYNLSRINDLAKDAVDAGAEVVSFHEGSVTAYSFLRKQKRQKLLEFAETVPGDPSVRSIEKMSKELGVVICAGLLERDDHHKIYNSYICVGRDGIIAKARKLHPFIHPEISRGDQYCVFELDGVRCGILICFDNNLVENVRCAALLGAEVIFMPHVTGCLPSSMPGRGLVDPALWKNRDRDPVSVRMELNGPKGRGWLMHWLPARAYDNGIYAVFANPIGFDDDQIRNGNAMIIDPFGEILAECDVLGDGIAVALCTPDKIDVSPGRRYIQARRTELYSPLLESAEESPVTDSGWGPVRINEPGRREDSRC